MPSVPFQRSQSLQQLTQRSRPFDIVIIGGGATGLSAALDAASRGHEVALVERHDFAKGTSSRSTKLVHGGVRYLRQGDISLVRDALRERALLQRNAPHLVRARDFIIPVRRWWQGPFYGIGLKMYDALAGKLGWEPSRWLDRKETLHALPGVNPDKLQGGVLYQDGQFDDARLALTLARTAADHGAVVLNHCACRGLLKSNGRISGVRVEDAETGDTYEIAARCVLNATGVFVDEVRRQDESSAAPIVKASQGAHVVLPAEFLPGSRALMVPETDDGRVFFAVPWHGRVIIGTTDTPVPETGEEPRALADEIEFLISHAARYLSRAPGRGDVLSVFAGLRPLVAKGAATSTAALSRDHFIQVADSGLITITGGKWTTCRKMGEDAIDTAEKSACLTPRHCVTRDLALHAACHRGAEDDHLHVYGRDAERVRDLAAGDPDLAARLHPRLPYLRAEVVWQAREEMARTVEDVLARRTHALLLDARAAIEAANDTAALLARELGWTSAQAAKSAESFRELARGYELIP
jgi:glycerol-3-phosphate dehydrogenase